MNSKDKFNLKYLIIQMYDICEDIKSTIYSINEKQITKKEVKEQLKYISDIHMNKIKRLDKFIKNIIDDTTY